MKPPPILIFLTYSFFLRFSQTFCATLPLQLVSLLSLKSSLNDPLSTLHEWQPAENPSWCSWSGIKCDNKSQIISLDLSQRNLSGSIPPQILYLSTSLLHLNLSQNAFDGRFPPNIFKLTKLRTLDVSHNYFNSTFPRGISNLRFLRNFNAYSNNFTGALPPEIVHLRFLEQLHFGGSYFEGAIPASYGGFLRLKLLHLSGNRLTGPLPAELGSITWLEHLEIGYNEFMGGVPAEIGSLSNLKYLDISSANLSGNVPPELGNLTALDTLLLFKNRLSGNIPASFSQLEALKNADLSDNRLSGTIPRELSLLKELSWLSLMNNNLSGEIPQGIGLLPNLQVLNLWNNSLTGILPQELGSNGKLQKLDVSTNYLTGPVPVKLCSGNQLVKLLLFNNHFNSELPASLVNCTSLSRFRIQNNRVNGPIPHGFGGLSNLTFMDLSNNNFTGRIPDDFANAAGLQYLNLTGNAFEGELPAKIWTSESLQEFSASSSKLIGKIPDFIGCKNIYRIELHGNSLNGSIPWDIGHCEKLIHLNLRSNSLTGIIPWEISTIPVITEVDLSHNFLTGTIPSLFDNCTTLETFNVSFNLLTGPIPAPGGVFSSLQMSSFAGNEGLCGDLLRKPCLSDSLTDSQVQQHPKKTAGAIVWIMAVAFGIGLFVLIAGTRCFRAKYGSRFSYDRETGPWKLTAFQRLSYTAEDVVECLSMTDKIVGMGSTGTVYKAEMPCGEIIAVKKLWGKQKETVMRRRGVLAEVDVLGNVRHRNIVRLLGCCSNRETTMLLYEYMPNGSLDDLLHGKNKGENLVADWLTRYKIALGVAQGICYLHHDCDPVIVHRDLKPSNILLDAEMEARVADFGVAKLIQCDESMSVIAGSYGYIAPEYVYTLQVDEKSDIYSYGVVLMEILSGKRSVDSEFGDGNSIVDWVRSKIRIKDGVNDILDNNAGASCKSVREEMMLVLRVALLCTSRNPADRPSMRDVVSMLQEAKPKRKLPGSGGANAGGGGEVEKTVVEC